LVDHIALKQKVVLEIWQQCHTTPDTWMRAGAENHPHHTLKFGDFKLCDIYLIRPISQGRSTIRNDHVVWWGQGVNQHASSRGDMHHWRQIKI